ncbi:uncharacterized protein TNCV_1785921 [Trichonephila clavipes]|nr:uncharacterized protein TNCV_1785921 [Trichonephila clavipes]
MPSIGGYHPYGLASILTGLESNRACVGYAWPTNCSPSSKNHHIPQDQIDNLILSMPRRCIFDVENAPRTGKPVVKNVDKITDIIEVDRHVSSCSISQELKIDYKTVLSYLR